MCDMKLGLLRILLFVAFRGVIVRAMTVATCLFLMIGS